MRSSVASLNLGLPTVAGRLLTGDQRLNELRWASWLAPARIVRNLFTVNGWIERPRRRWRNRAGPRDSSRMTTAMTSSSGERRISRDSGDRQVKGTAPDIGSGQRPSGAGVRRLKLIECSGSHGKVSSPINEGRTGGLAPFGRRLSSTAPRPLRDVASGV